jgi:hypothetical protein
MAATHECWSQHDAHLVHSITQYYALQGFFWKPGKTSKFWPIHSTIQIWTDFVWEWSKKKFFFLKKKIQNGQVKNAFFVFLGCFCPYVRQPHNHICWVTLMAFASINPTNPRTDLWNFREKISRIGDFEKRQFWKFFASFSWKSVQIRMVDWMGRNFDVFPGFQQFSCYT